MDTVCVMWLDGSYTNVPRTSVRPTDCELSLDQEVLAKWQTGKKTNWLKSHIYSLSAVSTRRLRPSKKKQLTSKVFDFEDEASEDENLAPDDDPIVDNDDNLSTFNEPSAKRARQHSGSPPVSSLIECSGCVELKCTMREVLEKVTETDKNMADMRIAMQKMEHDILLHSQTVKKSCSDVETQSKLLCQHVTASTSIIARIDCNADSCHTILTTRRQVTADTSTPGLQPATSPETPDPIIATPARSQRPANQAILDPPIINGNGEAIISRASDLAVPIEVFNSALKYGTASKFIINIMSHCIPLNSLTGFKKMQDQVPEFKLILDEALRRFPDGHSQMVEIKRSVTNKCRDLIQPRRKTTPAILTNTPDSV